MLGVLFSRRIILPRLPESKDEIILVSFSIIMLATSWSMIREKSADNSEAKGQSAKRVALSGMGVGIITGFVGAGGGFLILPALVNGIGLSMKKAVGTSLLIIALNSLSGFAGDLVAGAVVDWNLVLPFVGISVIGISIGAYLNRYVPGSKLKVGFGWFVLTLGSLMIIKQITERLI